jgi:hypothetical protein
MKIYEVVDPNNLSYYNVNDDKVNTRSRDDTRKPKLMLRDINKLKKIRALKKLAALKRQDVLDLMYGGSGDEGGGGGGGFGSF